MVYFNVSSHLEHYIFQADIILAIETRIVYFKAKHKEL